MTLHHPAPHQILSTNATRVTKCNEKLNVQFIHCCLHRESQQIPTYIQTIQEIVRFPQLWVLITLWLPVISVTRCWRALIWSIVSVVKEKIVPTAVCCATNRLLLSDRWASTFLESQFHCRYWCCQGGVLSELSPSPYKSTNEGLGK